MNEPVKTQEIKPLSGNEAARFEQLEKVIKDDMAAFVRVGMALAEIRDRQLYRKDSQSFEAYVRKVWDLAKQTAYQYIDAADVVEKVRNCGLSWTPANEAQARPLAQLAKKQPWNLSDVVEMVVESAGDGKITASHVKKAVKSYLGEKTEAGLNRQRTVAGLTLELSAEFKDAYYMLLEAIREERAAGYKNGSRKAIVERLDALRALLAEDGAIIDEPAFTDSDDANKLERAGYKIFRADRTSKTIKIRLGGGWPKHSGPYKTIKEMETEFVVLMQNKKHLRG